MRKIPFLVTKSGQILNLMSGKVPRPQICGGFHLSESSSDGRNIPLEGGILFLIYLGKVSFSGEVGGYPQALLKVVNLQGMLDFHRNFHLIKRVKIVVCLWGVFKGMHAIV